MSVVGFDFGNQCCKIAVARKRGIDVLQNEVGHRSTPAMVAFAGKQRFIGNEASAQYMSNGKNSIYHLKRWLGKKIDDPELKEDIKTVPFKLVKGDKDNAYIQVNYDDNTVEFAPEQITASLFIKLKNIAESGLENTKVSDCVISVPPSWTDSQRRAILDAAQIAGLNVLRLMNETTAVALQYGMLRPLPKDAESKVCFVDIGHSNTNAAVVGFSEGKLRVLGVAWDRNLGGRDFDEMLVTHFAKYIKEKYKLDPYTEPKAMMKLRKECERVKLMLSGISKVPMNVEYLMNDRDVSGMIERSEFESLAQAAIGPRLIATIKAAIERAGLTKDQIGSVEVVGGTTRIPFIQKALSDFFGKEVSKTCDGEESVARGCALMCAMISPSFKVKEFEVHDISPFPVELAWGAVPSKGSDFVADDSTPLFALNNPIPSVKLISFNDRAEPFMLVARYSDVSLLPPGTNPVVGRFIISGMPPRSSDPNVKPDKIKVRIKLDIHGLLRVTGAQLLEEIPDDSAPPAGTAATAASSTSAPAKEDDMEEEKPKADADKPAAEKKEDKDKMETEKPADAATASQSPDAKEAAAAKKMKVRKVDLKVESFLTGGLESAAIQSYFEKEAAMMQQDRVIHDTNAARNDLEAHILDMRNRLSDDLSTYARPADKEKIQNALSSAEDWLYGDGSEAQKSEYKKKLEELKALSNPLINRFNENANRSTVLTNLQNAAQQYKNWVNNTKDEKYAHIDANERKQVADEVGKFDDYLNNVRNDYSKLAPHEDAKVSLAQLQAKKVELDKFVNPIMNRPKPAPPKPQPSPNPSPEPAKPSAENTNTNSNANASAGAAGAAGAGAEPQSSPDSAKMETEH